MDDDGLFEMAAAVDGFNEIDSELERRLGGRLRRYFLSCGPHCKPKSKKKLDHKNDDGSQRWCRVLYQKHLKHFAAGLPHRERCFMAANRIGKSDSGGIETTYHLTGEYPDWWEGRRFTSPVRAWACGKTSGTVKEITQEKLMGPVGFFGAGFIPADKIHHHRMKRGEPDAVGTVWVRHKSGGISICGFKSYEEKRKGFEGTQQHCVWLDEEPPMTIYAECLLRTMATSDFVGGIIYATFTPLDGLTDLISAFMPNGAMPEGGVVPDEIRA